MWQRRDDRGRVGRRAGGQAGGGGTCRPGASVATSTDRPEAGSCSSAACRSLPARTATALPERDGASVGRLFSLVIEIIAECHNVDFCFAY